MSEVNPVLQVFNSDGTSVDAVPVQGNNRLAVLTRNSGVTRAVLWKAGQASVGATDHINFMNGTAWDMTVNGSTTPQTFSVSAGQNSTTILAVGLLMLTASRGPVFNGNSFGGQFLGGLLGGTLITPTALPNGILLASNVAGVSANLANLTVNEDFFLGNNNAQFGPIGGPYLLRARWEVNQVFTGGSSDRLTITIRDDLPGRGIAEVRAVAVSIAN